MTRLWFIIKKELLAVKENFPFHAIAVASPLLFLLFWLTALKQEVTMPAQVIPSAKESAFVEYLHTYATPSGVRYLAVNQPSLDQRTHFNTIEVKEEFQEQDGKITGHLVQTFHHIDSNITKNSKNRLTGAVSSYLETRFLHGKGITIQESPLYPEDVSWKKYFAVTLMVLGMLLSGTLFGALSFTYEWDRKTDRFLTLSPQSPGWVIGGKLIAGMVKCGTASLIFYLTATIILTGIFDEPFGSNSLILIPACLVMYVLVLSLGMLLGIVLKETILSFLGALLGSMFLWVLGGGFGTNAILTPVMREVIKFNPVTYAMNLIQFAFFRGQVQTGMNFICLTLAACGLLGLVIWQYYRQIYIPTKR